MKLLPPVYWRMKKTIDGEEWKKLPWFKREAYLDKRMNLVMTLIISYHNAGVECEYLDKYEEAAGHYEKGLGLSQGNLKKASDMAISFKKSLRSIRKKVLEQKR